MAVPAAACLVPLLVSIAGAAQTPTIRGLGNAVENQKARMRGAALRVECESAKLLAIPMFQLQIARTQTGTLGGKILWCTLARQRLAIPKSSTAKWVRIGLLVHSRGAKGTASSLTLRPTTQSTCRIP